MLDFSNEEHDGRYKGRQALEPSVLMRSNKLLRREINLLNVHRDERTAELEGEITRLQEANKDLNAMISRFRDMERVRANQFGTPLEEVKSLAAKLKGKDQELDRKTDQITALEEQLSAEYRLQDILDDMKSDFTCSSSFSKGLAELEEGAHQLAGFLVSACRINASGTYVKSRKDILSSASLSRVSLGGLGSLFPVQLHLCVL